jgi:rubrerythrin
MKSDNKSITERDRRMAQVCLVCPVCSHARNRQKGISFWFVRKIESNACPFCQAYEKVYGVKAHEKIPGA